MPKAHKNKPDHRLGEMREKFLERAGELWEKHEDEFREILEESEGHKMNVSFSAGLDFSESVATLETRLSFSQVMKDGTADTFDDPNQPHLPGTDSPEPEPKKKGRKASAEGQPSE